MSRSRIMINLHASDLERLRMAAARLSVAPGTLAARFVEQGLAGSLDKTSARPTAPLFAWLSPTLDALRAGRNWPDTITISIFDQIRDKAPDLYKAASQQMGTATLNREIGRFIRERLRARVVMRNGAPYVRKISPSRGSLITGATLLEPDDLAG